MVVFFLVAPPLVLYTAGFRYDFEYNRVVETGSLVVKSEPAGATVYLNGELQKQLTPTIINTILPGKIKLLVEKEGYHAWEKDIVIKPRVTAFEETVTLFAKTEPVAVTEHPVARYWWNNSRTLLAYTTPGGALRLFNTLNQKDTLISNTANTASGSLSWAPEKDQFVFSRPAAAGREAFILVDTQSLERIIPLSDVTKETLRNVQWDPVSPTALYGITAAGNLVRVNYLLRTERVVSEGPVLTYLAEPKRIVMIARDASGEPYVYWINPADPTTVHLLPEAQVRIADELVATHSRYIAFKNPRTNTLSIIDPAAVVSPISEKAITVIPNAVDAYFTPDGNTLVYSDGSGIYIRSFVTPISVIPAQDRANALVTRYSKQIRGLAVTENGRHVFYIVENVLRASELNAADDPRATVLRSDMQGTSVLEYSSQNNSLTFIGADGILQTLPLSLKNERTFPFGN